jgi:polysaccharide pyruvyl transferase WcaK-like protein
VARAGLALRAEPEAASRAGGRPAARPPRIALYGLFGIESFGNEGSLEAMIATLRRLRPDAELVCVCGNPEQVVRDHGIAGARIRTPGFSRRWARGADKLLLRIPRAVENVVGTLRRARRYDVLVLPGGGMLEDYCDRPTAEPLSLFLWCLGARLAGRRIAFVSVGAGPMRNPASRRLMTAAARMATYRSFRDTGAREFMGRVGVDVGGDEVFPDIAYGLPAPEAGPGRAGGDGLTVAIGAMLYEGYYPSWVARRRGATDGAARDGAVLDRYLSELATFVLWLLGEGHRVRMITGQTTDWRAVERLLEIVRSRGGPEPGERLIAEPASSLQGVMEQIADSDVVVATRYHNLVCSLKLGKPTIAVNYSGKNAALMADAGFADLCQEVDDLDASVLVRQFSAVLADRAAVERRIGEGNAVIARRLAEQEAIIGARVLP